MDKLSPVSSVKDIISDIEKNPLGLAAWEALADLVYAQKDTFSTRSLEVILEGLTSWEKRRQEAEQKNQNFPESSAAAKATFIRLAKSYNSPSLIKDAGRFYLQEGNDPAVALKHFERALHLGGTEKDLRPLMDAATMFLRKKPIEAPPARPVVMMPAAASLQVHEMIRKSGKLSQQKPALLPPRTGALAHIKRPHASLPSSPEACLEEAEKAIAERDCETAQLLLEKVGKTPLSSEDMWHAWSSLGLAYFESGHYAESEKAYAEAVQYRPDEMVSHFNLGTARHLNENFSGALASYHKAEAFNANHPKLWCNLGALFCQQDDYLEAERALRRAIDVEPAYARAWDNLGVALGAQNRLEEALQASRHAVELKPRYPEASFKIGIIEFSRNAFVEAIHYLQQATDHPSLLPYALSYLAMAQARMGQITQAEETTKRLMAFDPRFETLHSVWNELGSAWFDARDYAKAIEAHRRACALNPDDAQSWFHLGLAQQYNEEPAQARECLQRAIELQFNFPAAWHNLGLACSSLGRLSEATTAFQQEVRFAPANGRAWYDLAVSLEKEGLREKAQEAFAKADELQSSGLISFPLVA